MAVFSKTPPTTLDPIIDPTPLHQAHRGFLAPVPPPAEAPLSERERYRHALRSRHILLVAIGLAAAAYPIAFAPSGVNVSLIVALSVTISLLVLAMYFNSRLHTFGAGILAVSIMNLALMSQVVTYPPHRFDAYVLTVFCLFIQPELVALSMLGWRSIFVVVGVNILFMAGYALALPASAEVAAMLGTSWYNVWLRITTVHLFIAFVMFQWVRSEAEAIRRADRAAEVARLQQTIAHVEHQQAEEQHHFQHGIQIISQVHASLANGDLSTRVPYLRQPALQALGGKLNILITRYQRALSELQHLQQIQQALSMLQTLLHERHEHGEAPFPLPGTATLLDPLLYALNRTWQQEHRQEAMPKHLSHLRTHNPE